MDRNFYYADRDADWVRSLSARRAWIEIARIVFVLLANGSLSARRAWIEIPCGAILSLWVYCRSPQGERG